MTIFRYDPVPGLYHNRNQCGNFIHRRFRTFQERRDWKYFQQYRRDMFECYGTWITSGRSGSVLPEPWDDISHSTVKRSWKRTKVRRQWQRNMR